MSNVIPWTIAKDQAEELLGFTAKVNERPKPIYAWQAWSDNGDFLGISTVSEKDVSEIVGCSNTRRVITNEAKIHDWEEKNVRIFKATYDIWYDSFRSEYSSLSDALFSTCYQEACDRYEALGSMDSVRVEHDTVAELMESVVSFAEKILDN